jgi:uncharacterized membrane protein
MFSRIVRMAAAAAVVCLSAGVGSVSTGAAAGAQTTKSFSLSSLKTNATVNSDGTMDVREAITYEFSGGTFTFGTRTFKPAFLDAITTFTASENGQPLRVVDPASNTLKAWQWFFSPAVGTHTFELTYHVTRAVEIGSDVGRLYWQFIGVDHPGVDEMTVDIALPGEFGVAQAGTPDTDTSVVRVWAHGPRNGIITPDTSSVSLQVSDVPPKTFVEPDVVIPVKAFTKPGTKAILPGILKAEKNWLEPGQAAAARSKWLAPLLSALGLGGFGAAFVRWGKEPKTPDYIGDYWREPLEDPPAVVAATMSFGAVDGKAMASTMVDLAQRGFLTIAETGEKGFISKRPVYTFTATAPKPRVGQQLPPPPSHYELDLLANVFRGQNEVSSEDFRDWAESNQSTAASFWNGWKADVANDMKARGYIESNALTATLLPIGIAIALGGAAALLVASTRNTAGKPMSWWGLVCGAAAVLVLALTPLMRKRSVKGTEQAAKAKALKKYLEDFSNMNEAPVGSLILWERFLVYAVALGCAAKVYQGLRVRMPDMVNSGGFAPWYIPGYGHDMGTGLDRFPSEWGTSTQSAMVPKNTSSGSGGGFSGGGGGGGVNRPASPGRTVPWIARPSISTNVAPRRTKPIASPSPRRWPNASPREPNSPGRGSTSAAAPAGTARCLASRTSPLMLREPCLTSFPRTRRMRVGCRLTSRPCRFAVTVRRAHGQIVPTFICRKWRSHSRCTTFIASSRLARPSRSSCSRAIRNVVIATMISLPASPPRSCVAFSRNGRRVSCFPC